MDGEQGVDAAFLLIACLESLSTGDEAIRTLESALGRAREVGQRTQLPSRLALAARVMGARGRLREAEQLLLEALDAERLQAAEDTVDVAVRLAAIGRLCLRQGRVEEAMGWLEPAVSTMRRRLGASDAALRQAAEDLAASMIALAKDRVRDEPEMARAMALEVQAMAPWLVSNHPLLADARRLTAS
jgi:tetratricopeptide (TPR) repeat protein